MGIGWMGGVIAAIGLGLWMGAPMAASAQDCFIELEDGTRVDLNRRLCRHNLERRAIAPEGATGVLAFEELDLRPQVSATTAAIQGMIRNRSNSVVNLVRFRVDLMRDGVSLGQVMVPAPVAAIAPGQSVRFAHVFPHGLAPDVDWSALRPVLVSIEEAADPVEVGPDRDRGAEQPGGWIVDEAAPPSNALPSNALPNNAPPNNTPPSNVPPSNVPSNLPPRNIPPNTSEIRP
ncbi:MAG: hypothetical protein Fur0042_27900 [Cyanophyceae cyanobacterium]